MTSCRSFAALAAIALVSPALARPTSTFDTGPDGWTLAASTQWNAAGGNGGGFLFGAVDEPTNETAGAFAPAEFLGDWSIYNNTGSIIYDYCRFDNGSVPREFFPLTVVIAGPGGNATWTGEVIQGPTDWETVVVPIAAGAWSIGDGTWDGILANVSTFYIQIELVVNDETPDDTAGIDNISIVPGPFAAGFLALGLMAGRRRR